MNTVRQFQVRKYSYLRESWEHFPSRNDISLVVTNAHVIKIIWKTSILEELDTQQLSDLNIFCRSPSLGVNYKRSTGLNVAKFQLAFTSIHEYQMCLDYLQSIKLSVVDTNSAMFPEFQLDGQLRNPMMFRRQELVKQPWQQTNPMDMIESQPAMVGFHQQDRQQDLLTLQSNIEPTQAQTTMPFSQMPLQCAPDEIDYISKIIGPTKEELTDDELKDELRKRIKDPEFIKFVDRVEMLLKFLKKKRS